MEFDCSFSISELGSTNFRADKLRLGSSNEHVVTWHCVELSLVKTFRITFKRMFSVSLAFSRNFKFHNCLRDSKTERQP